MCGNYMAFSAFLVPRSSISASFNSEYRGFSRHLFRLSLIPLAFASYCFPCWGGSISNAEVQSIFDRNCIKCHSPLEHKSGLELETIEAALEGNHEGPVIVPGKPAESKLIAALSTNADPHMP